MNRFQNLRLSLGGLVLAGLAACGGGGGSSGLADGGSLRLALTDAPSCGFDAVNVTIQKVRVHQSGSANDTDGGWSEVVLNPPQRFDLLSLTNGVLAELGQTALPAGKYTQLRLVLMGNNSAAPLANSVLPTGGVEVPLTTPSAVQTGLKTNINITIAPSQLADFVLDFDACKSVVVAGSSGQYHLKPSIAVIPRVSSGVTGFVDAALANGNTQVSVQQGGAVIKATVPDSAGKFTLAPVAPGSYTLVLSASGRSTAIVTSVPVTSGSVTPLNSAATALNPAAASSGTLTGTAPIDTLVRALQPLTGGISAEVAGRLVNATTGIYSYVLPVSAPLVAPYVAPPASLVFVADAGAAGKYSLVASLAGFANKTSVLAPLTTGATLTTNFSFP